MLLVVIAIVVLAALYLLVQYNGLVKVRNRIEDSWAQIDVQLKRRFDLIPNLIETVKAYAAHERSTLDAVVQARTAAMSARTSGDAASAAAADGTLTGTLKSLFALGENYPDLKANTNFLALQEELTGTEDKIAYSRQAYNDSVRSYNTKVESFPTSLIARRFKFAKREYYQIDEASRGPVGVRL